MMKSLSYNCMMPIYPLLAQQCVDDYGLNSGICLDIGTGKGYVGVEIAKITHMSIYFIDIDAETVESAKETVAEADIDNEVFFVQADVCKKLPFDDNFADFIVSRGSIWFWKDVVSGLSEIHRVLKVGGIAFVGGGLSRYAPWTMRERLSGLHRNMMEKKGGKIISAEQMTNYAIEAGIPSFKVMYDAPGDKGRWIEIQKHL
ncbi:MAG: class I SAM-dependent methyltransferase [Syntrophaceticus sp.]